jgi:two-component system response regulator RegA
MGESMGRSIQNVLVVDDDEAILTAYLRALGSKRRVFTASTPKLATEVAHLQPLDLAIVDLRIGTESGVDLILELKRDAPDLMVALCSAYLSVTSAVAAMRAGADMILFKPISAHEILRRAEANTEVEPELDDTPTLARIEWEHITRVLADCDGNVSMAARRLGIYRSSLQRKLRRHAPRQ